MTADRETSAESAARFLALRQRLETIWVSEAIYDRLNRRAIALGVTILEIVEDALAVLPVVAAEAPPAGVRLVRRGRESWRAAAARVARSVGLDHQVCASYDALAKRGIAADHAAISALIEWDCAPLAADC
jgi:hypothetical protein